MIDWTWWKREKDIRFIESIKKFSTQAMQASLEEGSLQERRLLFKKAWSSSMDMERGTIEMPAINKFEAILQSSTILTNLLQTNEQVVASFYFLVLNRFSGNGVVQQIPSHVWNPFFANGVTNSIFIHARDIYSQMLSFELQMSQV